MSARMPLEWFVVAPSARIAGLCHSIVRAEPYDTCSAGCAYCYARWYRGPHGTPRPVRGVRRLMHALRVAAERGIRLAARMATLSDPFQPGEERFRASLGVLRLASRLGLPLVVNTRFPPPGEEWWEPIEDLARRRLLILQVTITGLEDGWPVLRKLEPGSPPPEERFQLVREASRRGVPVVVRLQPLIPGIGDRDPDAFVGEAASAGARGLLVEFLRAEPWLVESIRRLLGPVPGLPRWEPYAPSLGDKVVHPELGYRLGVASTLREAAIERGLWFHTCKEGLFHLHHPQDADCCAQDILLPGTSRKPYLGDLYRLALERGGAGPDEFWEWCRENPRLVCGERVSTLPRGLVRMFRLHERRLQRILERPGLVEHLSPSLKWDPSTNTYRALPQVGGNA